MSNEKIKDAPKIKAPEPTRDDVKPRKEGASPFDKILETTKLKQMPQNQQFDMGKTQEQTRVARHKDRGDEGKSKQDDEKEQERGKEKAKDERKGSADRGQKVVGRGRKGQGSKGQSGYKGGQSGRGHEGAMSKKSMVTFKKGAFTRGAFASAEQSKFSTEFKAMMEQGHLDPKHMQKLAGQIVKFLKTGLNEKGEKEIRLDLQEKIFRGLRLRIAMKDGKVSVHFNTANSDVRELFEGSKEAIEEALTEKGIDVADIKVT